jgi:valyl-tRNA synthetase
MREVVRAIRDLRAKYGVPPGKQLAACLVAAPEVADELTELGLHIRHLGALSSLEIGPNVARPELAGAQLVGELELFLAGVLDPVKEAARLQAQHDKLASYVASLEKKLANQGFLQNAPEAVVAAERHRLAESVAELAAVARRLAELG